MSHPPEPCTHRVLVVDDNPSIHDDFRKILCPGQSQSAAVVASLAEELFGDAPPEDRGRAFELDSAFQGQEALELVRRSLAENRPYSLAFVDVRMAPGWDGIETISRLWEICPRLQVVVCTAYSDYSWDQMHAKLGQRDSLVVLKKPFDSVEVQQLAHALTHRWELSFQAKMKMDDLENTVLRRTADLEKANLDLARSDERFAKVFHTSPVAMAIQSLPDRRFVDVNEQMMQLAGCSRDEMIGHCASYLFIWQAPQLLDDWFAALLRDEPVRDRETEVRSRSGSLRKVLVSLSLVTLSGQHHALVVVQDLADRNLLERQLGQLQKTEAI